MLVWSRCPDESQVFEHLVSYRWLFASFYELLWSWLFNHSNREVTNTDEAASQQRKEDVGEGHECVEPAQEPSIQRGRGREWMKFEANYGSRIWRDSCMPCESVGMAPKNLLGTETIMDANSMRKNKAQSDQSSILEHCCSCSGQIFKMWISDLQVI